MAIMPDTVRSTRFLFLRWLKVFITLAAIGMLIAGIYPLTHTFPPASHSHSVADDPTPTPTPPLPPCGGGVGTPCQ